MATSPVNEYLSLNVLPTIHLEDLPDDILDRIIDYVLYRPAPTPLFYGTKSLIDIPRHAYISSTIRIPQAFNDILALSTTCSTLRIKLAPRLFHTLSLVRLNQVDAILATPKSQELFSDKKRIHRELFKELIESNIESCGKAELARASFKTHVVGDKSYKSRYESSLLMTRYVSYLECDNSSLNGDDLKYFPNVSALRVLDVGASYQLNSQDKLPRLEYLAINARTLIHCPLLLASVRHLKRLDLFLDYGNLPFDVGISPLIEELKGSIALNELVLFLNNSYTIGYIDTINLLQQVKANSRNIEKLTIRYKRRKSESTVDQSKWVLYGGCVGDKLLEVFEGLLEVVLDISILDIIKFRQEAYNSAVGEIPARNNKLLILVDQAIVGPTISANMRENTGVVIRHCHFTSISFQYGESIEESHIHVLKLLTDFVQWLSNGRMDKEQNYTGIKSISLEKCWSVTDDSLVREHISDLIASKSLDNLKNVKPWVTSMYNSPRYKDAESYNVVYVKETGMRIMDSRGYLIGVSDSEIDKAIFTVVDKKSGVRYINTSFWSGESSLIDFEQYSIQQRKSLLWG
ncbi:hypothetical protein Cantr_00005 [Candida viswanathii]|uniref:Uncharacterized protein n=1 Tax=Candida viswanathii TaxID=5486 RepID=A0A367YI38_9ASCO|nr:hypothetical protein Cantr_00005 [Candida viswanathii]